MRLWKLLAWWSLLLVIALRPWIVEFIHPSRILLVQWLGLGASLAWWLAHRRSAPAMTLAVRRACWVLLAGFALSLIGHDRREAWLEGQGLLFGMGLCVAASLADERERRQLFGLFVVTGTLLGLHALWQAAVLFPSLEYFPWSQLTATEHVATFAAEVVARRRVFGPYPLPGLLAGALALLVPISVAVLTRWATTPARRIASVAIGGTQITALLLTQSLGGIGSLCIAAVWVLARRHGRWPQRLAIGTVALASIAMVLVVRPEVLIAQHPRNPIVQRWRYWGSTLHMIQDHPLRGVGAGNYSSTYERYRHPLATGTRFAHNVWLQAWAEWGLVGLVGLVGLLTATLRCASAQPLGIQVALWAFWLLASIDITWSVGQVLGLWWPLIGLVSTPGPHTPHP